MPVVEHTRSFITSVVVGKDVVPRIGLHQMEAMRADLINAIQRSRDPKVRRVGIYLFYLFIYLFYFILLLLFFCVLLFRLYKKLFVFFVGGKGFCRLLFFWGGVSVMSFIYFCFVLCFLRLY